MRRLALLLPLVCAMAAAGAAAAKEPARARYCGPAGCLATTDPVALQALMDLGRVARSAPAPAARGHRVHLTLRGGGYVEAWVRPGAGTAHHAGGRWQALMPAAAGAVRALATRTLVGFW